MSPGDRVFDYKDTVSYAQRHEKHGKMCRNAENASDCLLQNTCIKQIAFHNSISRFIVRA